MDDKIWEAFVELALPLAEVVERKSRYGDKPALVLGTREFAHCEEPGVIDLRVTAAAWRELRQEYATDLLVSHTASRRDWLELRLSSTADLERLTPLITRAISANR